DGAVGVGVSDDDDLGLGERFGFGGVLGAVQPGAGGDAYLLVGAVGLDLAPEAATFSGREGVVCARPSAVVERVGLKASGEFRRVGDGHHGGLGGRVDGRVDRDRGDGVTGLGAVGGDHGGG